jgi:hypothetical protein
MLKKGIVISLILLSVFSACVDNTPPSFQLPNNVALSNYQMLSLFFIEQLNEAPIKQYSAWNDSILKLTGINKINIQSKGLKNPEDIAERIEFSFDKSKRLMTYSHSKMDVSQDPLTIINFKSSDGRLTKYFGESCDQKLNVELFDKGSRFIRYRTSDFKDEFTIYGSIEQPLIMLEKSGKYISRVTVILEENEPLRKVESILKGLQIDEKELINAEKLVTYVDEHYRPQRTYALSEELIQTALVAEWQYEGHKKLISYKRFVNSSPIKDYEFSYSDDKLLRSFIYNRINYSVDYQ